MASQLAPALMKKKVICYQLELGNKLLIFRLIAPVIIRTMTTRAFSRNASKGDDDRTIQLKRQQGWWWNIRKSFSELKLVTDNLSLHQPISFVHLYNFSCPQWWWYSEEEPCHLETMDPFSGSGTAQVSKIEMYHLPNKIFLINGLGMRLGGS